MAGEAREAVEVAGEVVEDRVVVRERSKTCGIILGCQWGMGIWRTI